MSRADDARKADTPWRGQSSNAQKQTKARKKMSDFEAQTGITLEAFEADHAAQRAAVRARYGITS